jgi:hypothetical protein
LRIFAETTSQNKILIEEKFPGFYLGGAAIMGAFAAITFPLRNWFPVSEILAKSLVWQSFTLIVGLLAIQVYSKRTKEIKHEARPASNPRNETTKHRMSADNTRLLATGVAVLVAAINGILGLAGELLLHNSSSLLDYRMIVGCSPLFIPGLLLAWRNLRNHINTNRELVISSKLAGASAVNLLKKSLQDSSSWATSIGMRTSVFTIDHDPNSEVAHAIPASLIQIRNEEIQRCLTDILGSRLLHQHSAGQKIFGAVDAERSTRPCCDTLNLFACLYLDAGPLIERRLNGLSTLLPIINPGLSKILSTNVISEILKRNQWFFHLDFNWVDQQLINTQSSTRYGVQIDPVSSESRAAMMGHLRRAQGLGSYIWMGSDAHEKIIQEAPMLASIVEPITIAQSDSSDLLLFIVKFENLIPRLQRYFDLDDTRRILMDFEPSAESSKLINIFEVQSGQATTPEAMINLVDSIASYPWRGFKEKDQALKIVVIAHHYAAKFIEKCDSTGSSIPRVIIKLRDAIQVSVEKIGYPSQILHIAQMKKIARRDLKRLLESVVATSHSHFEESWTILSALDFKRYSDSDKNIIFNLFNDHVRLSTILSNKDVHGKIVDTLINLLKSNVGLNQDTDLAKSLIQSVSTSLAHKEASAETLTLLLDGVYYLSLVSGCNYSAVLTANGALAERVSTLNNGKTPYAQSLWNRWQELSLKSNHPKVEAA